ncbi:uncharacterized protein LOC144099399 [Amblyomma americanum]|uniref:Peptidase M13 N-terminal domain-containing protein n=1 Tax=Amblyomma americanum TaxID=6943 RepID=A0AAQ4EUS9_AMBAM
MYSDAMDFSRHVHADPCYSFYEYVCGGWTERRFDSVLDTLLVKFRRTVTELALRTQAPSQFQNPSQRAAKAYMSCINVLHKQQKEVGELKAILFNAELRWPQQPPTGNVASPFLYLCKDWSLLFLVGIFVERGGNYVLSPTGQFTKVLEIWETALYNSKHNRLFEILYNDHVSDESTAVTYAQMSSIENQTISLLRHVPARDEDEEVLTTDNLWELTPHLERSALFWYDALKNRMGLLPSSSVTVTIRQASFVRAFLDLPRVYGESNFMLYMGWVVAQLFSIYTDSDLMTEFYYGTRDATETMHRRLCFAMVQRTMGFAFNAEYVNGVVSAGVRTDVATMVGHVYAAFSEMLTRPGTVFPEEVQLPAYDNGTGAVFEFVDRSSNVYLTRVFSSYTDMSPLLAKTWEAVNKGFSVVLPTDVSPWPLEVVIDKRTNRKTPVLTRQQHYPNNDFSIMPYAFAFPVYDLGAPLSIRYGALGSEVASAMAELLFTNKSSWNESASDGILDEVTCFFRKTHDSWQSISDVEWQILYRLASVGALWEAYSVASTDENDYLAGQARMHADQLFFFFWCYLQCGEPAGQHSCDGPLRHLRAFQRTFDCGKNSHMVIDWRCTFFGDRTTTTTTTTPAPL